MSQYTTGTVAVTNGSAAIVGTGTAWLANVTAGSVFTLPGSGVPYVVGSVADNTHLTLASNYAGATASGLAYSITTSYTPNLNLPYPEQGDTDTSTILKRAMLLLDGIASMVMTFTNKTFVAPVLGTPASGALDNCTSNTEAAGNNSTQLATTAYADRLTAGALPGAFTALNVFSGVTTGGIVLGADTGVSTRTNAVQKVGRIAVPHYLTAEEGIFLVGIVGGSATNTISYGGGSGSLNAATEHAFYATANNTTLTGTPIAQININGFAVTGAISGTTTIKTGGYTVATLPAGTIGAHAYVTDATAPTYLGALTGGGAVVCPVFKNATAWVSA